MSDFSGVAAGDVNGDDLDDLHVGAVENGEGYWNASKPYLILRALRQKKHKRPFSLDFQTESNRMVKIATFAPIPDSVFLTRVREDLTAAE